MFTVTKSWRDFPAAHRQPRHDGHCRLIHGHNWGFDITFVCDCLDGNGFVVDVGRLGVIKSHLENLFDHTLLIDVEDPEVRRFRDLELVGLCHVRLVPNCGMEGLAHLVAESVQRILEELFRDERGVSVMEVVCWEDGKNRASYIP